MQFLFTVKELGLMDVKIRKPTAAAATARLNSWFIDTVHVVELNVKRFDAIGAAAFGEE